MHFWGLTIDTSSAVLLTVAMGLAVDYAAHVGRQIHRGNLIKFYYLYDSLILHMWQKRNLSAHQFRSLFHG